VGCFEGFLVGRRVGELLGLFDGDVVDGDKLGLFDGFDVVGFVGLLDGLLVVGILVGEMVGIEVGGFVFGAAVVNSNKLSVLMKWDDGKLSLLDRHRSVHLIQHQPTQPKEGTQHPKTLWE
jgi:hypothetical protein